MRSTTASAFAPSPAERARQHLLRWWHDLAWRHRSAELSLHLLFISGIPLWSSLFILSWDTERTLLFVHSIAGLVLFPLSVLPFWLSHRRLIQRSRKPLLKKTGRVLDLLLLLSALSGFYLMLIGNRGDLSGAIAHYLHLVTAVPLCLLLIRHALRWSVLSFLYRPFLRR